MAHCVIERKTQDIIVYCIKHVQKFDSCLILFDFPERNLQIYMFLCAFFAVTAAAKCQRSFWNNNSNCLRMFLCVVVHMFRRHRIGSCAVICYLFFIFSISWCSQICFQSVWFLILCAARCCFLFESKNEQKNCKTLILFGPEKNGKTQIEWEQQRTTTWFDDDDIWS